MTQGLINNYHNEQKTLCVRAQHRNPLLGKTFRGTLNLEGQFHKTEIQYGEDT